MTEPCTESSDPHSTVPKELTRTVPAAYFSPDGSPLREVAFGVGLQTPGNAAHQELFVWTATPARTLPGTCPSTDLRFAVASRQFRALAVRSDGVYFGSFGSLVPLCAVSPACGKALLPALGHFHGRPLPTGILGSSDRFEISTGGPG